VALPDGSTVLLQPDSRISFPEAFGDEKRDVYLSGQAFFEVTKDPRKPFYVFANEMVTRVLGTSFTVRAFDDQSSFTVIVKTGKVNVSASNKGIGQKIAQAVDLTPNQQVTFHRKDLSLIRSNVKTTAIPVPATENFYAFNDAPVTEIFKKLSKEYDVNIQIQEKLLADCALTTTLMDEPLFVKLKIICEAIGPGTNFSVLNDTIVINSKGCNQ
jgi:transmembrane sensor